MISRTNSSKRNIISGLIQQLLNIIFPFVIRTVIIYFLGELYAGVSSLFNSILQVLNLADLGFSSAIIFALYKPIGNKKWDEVGALILYLKKIYKLVGLIILIVGLALSLFLNRLITGELPQELNIYILYFIYLLNSVVSYFFFAYKSALLTAMQRTDIVNNIGSITSIITKVMQIIILIVTKNFYAYIILNLFATVVNNVFYEIESRKLFPYIKITGKISNETRILLNKQLKGVVFNRIGDVARNSFDNIILSTYFGLTIVATYNNYFLIYSSLYGITCVIIRAVQASVGNSLVCESIEKNYKDLRKFTFIFTWFTGWCTVSMFILYQPFMYIWMRGNSNLLLANSDMILFCIYFYVITMNGVRNLYLEGSGLFWECRVWYLVEAFGNLFLNIFLGHIWGITGVLIATILTIFFFNFLSRTTILFQSYFKCSKKEYYRDHLIYFLVTLIAGVITNLITKLLDCNGILRLLLQAFLCVLVPNIVFLFAYYKTNLFKISIIFIKGLLRKSNHC